LHLLWEAWCHDEMGGCYNSPNCRLKVHPVYWASLKTWSRTHWGMMRCQHGTSSVLIWIYISSQRIHPIDWNTFPSPQHLLSQLSYPLLFGRDLCFREKWWSHISIQSGWIELGQHDLAESVYLLNFQPPFMIFHLQIKIIYLSLRFPKALIQCKIPRPERSRIWWEK
jgi:hypothetical protein